MWDLKWCNSLHWKYQIILITLFKVIKLLIVSSRKVFTIRPLSTFKFVRKNKIIIWDCCFHVFIIIFPLVFLPLTHVAGSHIFNTEGRNSITGNRKPMISLSLPSEGTLPQSTLWPVTCECVWETAKNLKITEKNVNI